MDPASVVEPLFGGFVVEIYGAFIMYGVITVQAYSYILRAARDPIFVKCVAFVVWSTETLQIGFLAHLMYYYTMHHFGDVETALIVVWSGPTFVATERFVVLVVHSYFLLRIWVLSNRSWVLISVAGFFLIARLGFSVEFLLTYGRAHTWMLLRQGAVSEAVIVCTLVLGVVSDLLIAGSFAYYIHRDRTGFRSTDNIVQSMVKYIVNTGMITTATSFAMLFTYIFCTHSLTFVGFIAISSKLYANSFFAILNASHKLKTQTAIISNRSCPTELRNISESPSSPLRWNKQVDILRVRETSQTRGSRICRTPRANSPNEDDFLGSEPFDIYGKITHHG
ncbi:hypothetical protein BXZ70DRAFT_763877 [Cristinia sonorae]|uniref:DUF6534 domain-containing protein n=1 Tax=Cristinia sonorae TaxID=1940300 RepID=A0A8K0USM8_9AGAR|nr:hypothetical protein BXZ70DRAFT_763877 [Cristinia sonorae]